jgi:hypothetical protein
VDRSIQMLPPPWRSAGGCDFALDPEAGGRETPIFWTPDADPATILLTPSPITTANSPLTESFTVGGSSTPVSDGAHRILFAGGEGFPIVILSEPAPGASLAAIILLDDDTPDRLAALTRFWTGLRRPPAPSDDRLTPQRRRRLQQMLRVVDGRHTGNTYRAIAEALFPKHRIDPASWAGDALRETTIRLARDGFKLVEGGYRTILRRPRRS